MSCRSRANRLRSLSTASRAFSSWAETSSMLREQHLLDPEHRHRGGADAERQAALAAPVEHQLAEQQHQRRRRASTSGAAHRGGKQHHHEHRDVDGGRGAGLPEAEHITHAERDQAAGTRGSRVAHRRLERAMPLPVRRIRSHDRHVDGAEQRPSRRCRATPATVSRSGPAGAQRVEQEEQPDGGEERPSRPGDAWLSSSPGTGRVSAHGGHGSGTHTRAVSLLIRHAAPRTKIANQPIALTMAYHGSSWVSGARATSATPYIGDQ